MEMTGSEATFFGYTMTEYVKAKQKHPDWPDDLIHAAAIVAEESGELVQAALQYEYESGNLDLVQEELLHTAAMCLRMYVNLQERFDA